MCNNYLKYLPVLVFAAIFSGISESGRAQNLSFLSDSVSYQWPTNASNYLSSTFAETRSAHLHSGLDIRTWGREGYEVYATRDAQVYRIAIGPDGYGKVIYLKHGDNSYSVYAHLQRFEPQLQAYADSIRMVDYSFKLDHQPVAEQFSYKKGELIGYSGSTGVGPPHLHFELRTPDFEAFNPLLSNLEVEDDIPPVINSLAIETLDPNTLQYKGYQIIQPLRSDSVSGTLDFGSIQTNTPIGIAIDAHDKANRAPNFYAVYELLLISESDTLFHSKADGFGFHQSSMMFLDRSYPILAQTRRGYQRLFRVNGNDLPVYKKLKNRGLAGLQSGTQDLKIIAKDIYGNERMARLTVETGHTYSFSEVNSLPAYPASEELSPSPSTIYFADSRRNAPAYTITGQRMHGGPYGDDNAGYYLQTFENSRSVTRKLLVPGRRQILPVSDHKAWLEIPSDALYDTLSVQMEYRNGTELPSVRFSPNRIPVQNKMNISILLPESIAGDSTLGLYSYDEFRDRHTFLSSDISDGVLTASIREFAELQIQRDNNPPWVGAATFRKDPAGNVIVHVPVADRQSGIDYDRSDITVNGERGIIEYDKDKNQLIFYNPEFSPVNGENSVEIRVSDRTGNQTARSVTLPYDG